jgi:hypothetical protein
LSNCLAQRHAQFAHFSALKSTKCTSVETTQWSAVKTAYVSSLYTTLTAAEQSAFQQAQHSTQLDAIYSDIVTNIAALCESIFGTDHSTVYVSWFVPHTQIFVQ